MSTNVLNKIFWDKLVVCGIILPILVSNSAGGKGDNVWFTDVVFVRLYKTGKYYPLGLEELLPGACEIQPGRRCFILG